MTHPFPENAELPALPTRVELELQKSSHTAVVPVKEDLASSENAVQADHDRMAVAYGDDTLVDINFECE